MTCYHVTVLNLTPSGLPQGCYTSVPAAPGGISQQETITLGVVLLYLTPKETSLSCSLRPLGKWRSIEGVHNEKLWLSFPVYSARVHQVTVINTVVHSHRPGLSSLLSLNYALSGRHDIIWQRCNINVRCMCAPVRVEDSLPLDPNTLPLAIIIELYS